MSISAIETISDKLVDLIQAALDDDTESSVLPTVVLNDPATLIDENKADVVSLWLYHVSVDEFSRNASPRGFDDPTLGRKRFALPPLGLDLSYLVTPILADRRTEQHVLSVAMLALYESAVLNVVEGNASVNEQVRISLQTGPFDERIRLWESLGKPHRLSVGYQVRTARLASRVIDNSAPITATTTGLSGDAARLTP